MLEAKLIGLKEGLKIAIVWLVFYSYLVKKDRSGLIKYINYGIVISLIITIIMLLMPQVEIDKQVLTNIIATSLAVFFIFSAAALFHASGTNLFRPLQAEAKGNSATVDNQSLLSREWASGALIFLTAIVFIVPDSLGSLLFLKEFAFMRDAAFMTYAYALLGLVIPVVILFLINKFYKPYWIGNYFAFPQLILFLAVVKLLGSGTKGIAEMSLIPSVQRGFMKFVHDVIHQVLVLFMVPDHPLLQTTVWDFIGMFFGANMASYASLFILLAFPFMFIYFSMFKPLPEPDAFSNVERRKIKSRIISDRRKKALPVFLFVLLVVSVWFIKRGETVSEIYKPPARPVVVDSGSVLIPLKDPSMDLTNGLIHKFSLVHEGEEIRIAVIRKSGRTLSVSLDACEICPPDGYGQREDHVVCLYCNTPIDISSMGMPGGCNPIPLSARYEGGFMKIDLKEILDKWGFVKTGKAKEGVL